MTHTKGEWVWYNGCSWWRLGTKEGSGRVGTLIICPTTASDNQPDLIISEDNRKRIVQCVNSHDELVEALELALRWHTGDKWRGSKNAEEVIAWDKTNCILSKALKSANSI